MKVPVRLLALAAGPVMIGVLAIGSLSGWFSTKPKIGTLVRLIDPDNPCGPVTVALATLLVGEPIGLDRAKAGVDTDPLGRCSLAQIAECLEANGCGAAGVRLSHHSFKNIKTSVVAILFVDRSHFIVVKPLDGGSVVVFDPPRRPFVSGLDRMPYEWSGESLIVARDDRSLRQVLDQLGLSPGAATY